MPWLDHPDGRLDGARQERLRRPLDRHGRAPDSASRQDPRPRRGLVSLWFSQQSGQGVVLLLLLGYSLVAQLFPAATISLLPNNFVTKWGAGIAAGVATVTYVTVAGTTIGDLLPFMPQALADTNIGIVALFVSFVVMVGVSLDTGGLAVRREQQA